jgi:hypothetical protein
VVLAFPGGAAVRLGNVVEPPPRAAEPVDHERRPTSFDPSGIHPPTVRPLGGMRVAIEHSTRRTGDDEDPEHHVGLM